MKGDVRHMQGQIAIVDADPIFARCVSRRLMRLIPWAQIALYEPDQIRRGAQLSLTESVILYDEAHTDAETLRIHAKSCPPPCLIPLQVPGPAPRRKMTATELSRKVQEAAAAADPQTTYPNAEGSSPFVRLADGRVSSPTPRGHMRLLLSFSDRPERERYAEQSIKSLAGSGLRIIRLDLMSGISIIPPFPAGDPGGISQRVSGISELLLRLENTKMEPEEILGYTQAGTDGCLHFGPPVRADDIVCSSPEILANLLKLLRRLCDTSQENTAVVTVIESLPFRVLRQICPIAHELHVIMPPQGQADPLLCESELHELFSSLPPGMMKFVSEAKRASA